MSGVITAGPRSARPSRTSFFVGAGVAAAVVSVVILSSARSGPSAHAPAVDRAAAIPSRSIDGITPIIPTGQPCYGATRSTVAELLASPAVALATPSPATRTGISSAWTCGDQPTFMLGDIVLTYEPDGAVEHPESLYRDLAADGGSVEQVDGVTAFVQPPNADSGSRGEVMFQVGTIEVKILGQQEIPIERLLAIAKGLTI